MGKTIRSNRETSRDGFIRISRSFLVVSRRMMGGWMTGTSAMYEYAAIEMAPSKSGASRDDRKMAVGPSAPPMIPIARGLLGCKGQHQSTQVAQKDTDLSGSTQQDQLGIREHGGEVHHGTDTEKNEGGIDPLLHTEIEIFEDRAFIVDTQGHTRPGGDVTDQNAKANRYEQQGFVMLDDGEADEGNSNHEHHDVPRRELRQGSRLKQLVGQGNEVVHRCRGSLGGHGLADERRSGRPSACD